MTSQGWAQEKDAGWVSKDTLNVIVKAYEINRPSLSIPAAISIVDEYQFSRFTGNSLLSALNMEPGVRLEERSPASFRLNMRGSSLRSPFGIRNVKVYLNEIPFTDPGGNTYLNQLDFRNLQSVELIKGPAGSLYGAGTGGAMLLNTLPHGKSNHISLELMAGSFGLRLAQATFNFGNSEAANNIGFVHQQSDGWRDHTAMLKDIITYQGKIRLNEKQTVQTLFLYGNLYYQTPGGLTLTQYLANPREARPKSGNFPSAESAKAAIYQENFLVGITHEYKINRKWKNTTALYGASTWFKNPTFRLFEKRTEPHFGARSFFANDVKAGNDIIHLVYGLEAQKGIFTSSTYKNKEGNPDSIFTNDEIINWRYSLFAQAEWLFGNGFNLTAGISYNRSHVGIERLLVYPNSNQKRNFNSDVAPRIAIMKAFKKINIYATVSRGFSPPTTSELLPGTGEINTTLQSEEGINYETGFKASGRKLSFEMALYHYNLKNAISLRRDAGGGDFYTNAGETRQNGIEFTAAFLVIENNRAFIRNLKIFTSYTGNFYAYNSYKVVDKEYAGHSLPGIPNNNIVAGLDLLLTKRFYSNITCQWVDKIPLNDANDAYADNYQILGARIGSRISRQKKYNLEVYVAADNLLNQVYSLGNDINAAGGRYYNAASARNFSAGLIIKL